MSEDGSCLNKDGRGKLPTTRKSFDDGLAGVRGEHSSGVQPIIRTTDHPERFRPDFYFIIGWLHVGLLTFEDHWAFSLAWMRPRPAFFERGCL